jgi:intein-encoded DNA endonuclease-like protein
MEAYAASKKCYGYRRIARGLREKRSVIINHKAVLRLMNHLDIRSLPANASPISK